MNKVILVFPDNTSIADFIVSHQVSNAEVNSIEQCLVAVLEENEIITAVDDYGARLKVSWNFTA